MASVGAVFNMCQIISVCFVLISFMCVNFSPVWPIAHCEQCDQVSNIIVSFFTYFGSCSFCHMCFEAIYGFRTVISSWRFGLFFFKEMSFFLYSNVFALKSILPESTWTDIRTAKPVFFWLVFAWYSILAWCICVLLIKAWVLYAEILLHLLLHLLW